MIYEQRDDEALVLSGEFDISIPFSFAFYKGCTDPDIKVYPSLRSHAEEFLSRFDGDALFTDGAVSWAKEHFGSFLLDLGFELGEESDDYFINYRIEKPNTDFVLCSTQPMGCVGELENLTGYDFDALWSFGHMCFATVIDGKIVSAACTNSPVEDGVTFGAIEIGVETAPMYEGKGFGRSNAAALAAALASRGCTALYECASKNTASVRLIERLGGVEYAKNYYIVGMKV